MTAPGRSDRPPEPPYQGRIAALTTRHGKESLIGPALAPCGLEVIVADVDTDAFGTFTGEVPRRGDPVQVATRKARAAMTAAGTDAGLASEGSFGPHPAAPFLTADLEFVVLVDDRHGITVAEQAVSFDTAAAAITLRPGEDAGRFCARVGFPGQALICRPGDGARDHITKAITSPGALRAAIDLAARRSLDGTAIVETDLRAHLCPTRRPVISQAARRLAERLGRICPGCARPGYGALRPEPGLPCGQCGLPSQAPAATITWCPACGYQQREPVTGTADPGCCEFCNP